MSSPPHYPHRDALQWGLDLYRKDMSDFIVRHLRQKPGLRLPQAVANSLADRQRQDFEANMQENGGDVAAAIEITFIPRLIEYNWNDLFQQPFRGTRTIRNTLRILRDLRNTLAHNTSGQDIPAEMAQTGLYHISEALVSINRPEQSQEVLARRARIQPTVPPPETAANPVAAAAPPVPPAAAASLAADPPAASPPAATAAAAPSARPPAAARSGDFRNLKAWRLAIQPNGDVADGSFLEAEFAANLQQVYDGSAPAVYGDPREFFRRTYLTNGMKELLTTAVQRLQGKGGNPILRAKTGFGGGKTHSLIALYHLVHSSHALLAAPDTPQDSRVSADLGDIMRQAGVDPAAALTAKTAVLYGPWLSENSDLQTDRGAPRNTLWGELAWQLGGTPGYEIIGAAARSGRAPDAGQLTRLFRHVGPCVILMDEIINYARNADLDRTATFLQNLTEAVQHPDAGNALLVVTLPVTQDEAGGSQGMEALNVVESLLNRVQSVMAVAETANDEAFAVVRRRLFQEDCDTAAREETCQTFYRMYQRNAGDYPPEARETRYLNRLRQCYPIHPEIFDRLYQDWSVYHEFQRTRGVLRLMAQTLSRLYAAGDDSPLIMPANLPFADTGVSDAFLRLLGPEWDAVLGEVDRENSLTRQIDLSQPSRFGVSGGGAAQRVARAVFLGSSTRKAIRGLDQRQINLSVVAPGHGAAAYKDAVREMDGKLYYFYRGSDDRYFFDAEQNLNKVANDRALELLDAARDAEICKRLNEFRNYSPDRAVLVAPAGPAEVPDSDTVRLIILGPSHTRPSRSAEGQDQARNMAQRILTQSGDQIRRTKSNTLLFLAAGADQMRDLRSKTARYLAWDSLLNGERRLPNLSSDRINTVRSQINAADREVREALPNAYRWVLAPTQPDPLQAEYDTTQWRQLNPAPDLAANAREHFTRQGQLVPSLDPAALNAQLEAYLWRGPNPREHISVAELWDILTSQVYLGLRLPHRGVLEQCLRQGIAAGLFGLADGYDPAAQQYRNVRLGETSGSYLTDATLIMPGAKAAALLPPPPAPAVTPPPAAAPGQFPADPASAAPPGTPPRPRQFTARKFIDSGVAMYDFNLIRDEIARTIADGGGQVTVEITVTGFNPDGFSESIARALRQNGQQLGLNLETE